MNKILRTLLLAALFFPAVLTYAAKQTVTVANYSFTPSSFTISLGDTVVWQWSNGSHTTTSLTIPTGAASWNSPMTSTSTSYTYVPTVSGTYNYQCTPHSSMMTGSFTVSCGAGPAKAIVTSSTGSASTCQGTTYMLSTTVQGGATYQWSNGSGSISGATAATYTPSASGTYTVKVSRCSIDSVSAPFTVTINPNPTPSFTQSHTGLAYTFTNTTSPITGNNYTWTFSDGSPVQTTTDATRTFAAPGNYTVTLKATNINTTCFASTSPLTITAALGIGTIGTASYTISPNPASSKIGVRISEEATVQLADLSGRTLASSAVSKLHSIDVSTLPAGIYMLRIQSKSASVTELVSVTR